MARASNEWIRSHQLQSVTANSRDAKPRGAFVAVQGQRYDGHAFLEEAHRKGASLLVGELPRDQLPSPLSSGATYLSVPDSRLALADLAAEIHGNPSRSMKMIGVTGTSGKTTTTHLIESILIEAGEKVGLIGTIATRYPGSSSESSHTTPDSVSLQSLLARMRDSGCTAVVMEVSSHALAQRRTDWIAWDAAVFHNLSPEHLDFHPTLEDYFQAKCRLFKEGVQQSLELGKKTRLIVNGSDAHGKRLAEELKSRGVPTDRLFVYRDSDWIRDTAASAPGAFLTGEVHGLHLRSELVGSFNAENILAAVTVGQALGLSSKSIEKGIERLKGVPGRLERVGRLTCPITVLVDYAHKPDALEKVLRMLGASRKGRLITVVGCGGDRDRAKRPVMARIAAELSAVAILTSDNPRSENPRAILEEMIRGNEDLAFEVIEDRRTAIFRALEVAREGDTVLIAGKGHETGQIIGDQKYPFDDRLVAAEALQQRGFG